MRSETVRKAAAFSLIAVCERYLNETENLLWFKARISIGVKVEKLSILSNQLNQLANDFL